MTPGPSSILFTTAAASRRPPLATHGLADLLGAEVVVDRRALAAASRRVAPSWREVVEQPRAALAPRRPVDSVAAAVTLGAPGPSTWQGHERATPALAPGAGSAFPPSTVVGPEVATFATARSWPASPVELWMGDDHAWMQTKAAAMARLVRAGQARRRAIELDSGAGGQR